MFYRINFETTALNNAKWFTVHFSQSAPVVSHTTLLESHRSRRFGHFRVLLAEFVPSESLRAYDSCSYCQESANYRKQVFTSICAKKAVEYRQTCGNTYARIWRFFIDRQVTLFSVIVLWQLLRAKKSTGRCGSCNSSFNTDIYYYRMVQCAKTGAFCEIFTVPWAIEGQ